MNFSNRMIEYRKANNLSQSEAAEAAGVTKSSWNMYERGERIPRDEIKVKIAALIGFTVGELFFNESVHETRTP